MTHRYDLSGSRVRGPLAEWAAGFALYMLRLGYSAVSVSHHLALMGQLSGWLDGRGVTAAEMSPSHLDEFMTVMRRRRTHLVSAVALVPLLGYLREVGAAAPSWPVARPVDARGAVLEAYQGYLRERHLSETTISSYCFYAAEFLRLLDDPLDEQLAGLTGGRVLAVASAQLQRYRPASVAAVVNGDRSLLRYLDRAGVTALPLASVIPTAARRHSRLPAMLDASMVSAMLASCDRDTEVGCRDFAVLTLLRRYGMRRIEISRMEIADLRWREGQFVVRGKGGRSDVLPLMRDAGEAIVDYLRMRRRPASAVPAVFLTVKAPARPLNPASIHGLVSRACARAGITAVGPREFRHGLGHDLRAAGASLLEIRDVLRHEHVTTTTGYVRTDLSSLTVLVRPWPHRGQRVGGRAAPRIGR